MSGARWGTRRELTLIEATLAAILVVTLLAVVAQLVMRSQEVSRYTPLLNRANEVNQEILQHMRSDLVSSVKLFQNDDLGAAYLRVLDMDGSAAPIESILPAFDPNGLLGPEAPGATSGNTLLFARFAWTAEHRCRSGNRYAVDVYRLVRNYLTEEGIDPEAGGPAVLNLARWVSEPLVDGDQIDEIDDAADRAEVLDHLLGGDPRALGARPPAAVVWRSGGHPGVAGTFRQIGVGGFLSSAPLPARGPRWRILRDAVRSSDRLLDTDRFQVARDRVLSRGPGRDAAGRDGVFRPGFQVRITGNPGARRVLLELVLESAHRSRLPARSSLRVAVNTREI